MPRKLRLESKDGVYHVFNRGNYRADQPRAAFLHCLGEICAKTGWVVYYGGAGHSALRFKLQAYSLMPHAYSLKLLAYSAGPASPAVPPSSCRIISSCSAARKP
jgi:hypothetical protein